MNNYVSPVIFDNDELAEGVYASGSGSDCYTVTGRIHQTPETGRETYVLQFDADHHASDGHHGTQQTLVIYFNQNVEFVKCTSSHATLTGGDGSSTISITYDYHQNAVDAPGLGEVEVKSNPGLVLMGCMLTCNYECAQHPEFNR